MSLILLCCVAALIGAALMPRHQVEAIQRGESAEWEGRIWGAGDLPEIRAAYAAENHALIEGEAEKKAESRLKTKLEDANKRIKELEGQDSNKRVKELETELAGAHKRIIGDRKPLELKDGKPEHPDKAEQIGEHWYELPQK